MSESRIEYGYEKGRGPELRSSLERDRTGKERTGKNRIVNKKEDENENENEKECTRKDNV